MNIASQTLQKQFKSWSKEPLPGFHITLQDDNIFDWKVGVFGPPATLYQGGYFMCTLKFPSDYPFSPPSFTFDQALFHPNVYSDGRVCISILHPPGDDPMSGEKAEERWNPTQSVESILLSVVSLLNDPNCSSPANVDAAVMFRNDIAGYTAKVKDQVNASKAFIPRELVLKSAEEHYHVKPPAKPVPEDENFWYDDEEEDYDEDEEVEEVEDDE